MQRVPLSGCGFAAMNRRLVRALWRTPLVGLGCILAWFFVVRAISPLLALKIRSGPAARAPSPAFQGRLRIVTYNICHGRGDDSNVWPIHDRAALDARLQGIAAFLKREAPDLAVLNEVDFDSMFTGRMNQAESIARAAGFPFWIEQRDIDVDAPLIYTERFGNALLSRFPIRGAALVRLPGYAAWEVLMAGCARAVLAEIELAPQTRVRLLGTHLESRSEQTRVQSAQLIETIRRSAPLPLIVAGDLNTCPTGFPYAQQFRGRNALSLLLEGGGYATLPRNNPAPADSTGSEPREVIDWILVPAPWRILARRSVPLPWSDHRAVVMDVALGKPAQ